MHQRLKERLVGAAVLVVIAVIFIPMLLTGPVDSGSITTTNIPERPTDKFNSKLVPVTELLKPIELNGLEDTVQNDALIETGNAEERGIEATAPLVSENKPKEATSIASTKPATEKPVKDKQVGLTAWVVQLGSFSSKVNSDKLNLKLRKSGFPAFVEPLTQNKKTVYRVRVGPELLHSDADNLLKKIKAKMKLDGIVISYP